MLQFSGRLSVLLHVDVQKIRQIVELLCCAVHVITAAENASLSESLHVSAATRTCDTSLDCSEFCKLNLVISGVGYAVPHSILAQGTR